MLRELCPPSDNFFDLARGSIPARGLQRSRRADSIEPLVKS